MNSKTRLLAILAVALAASPTLSQDSFIKNADERSRIEQALPKAALVQPLKPRRLLIFTLNVGYGGHPSIAYANEAFTLMGKKTGAFETVVTNDPAVFERNSLKRYDAVFFNNTVGNCFTNAEWRANLLEFITGGGGLMGVHGTSVAFTHWPGAKEDWPEFGYVLGARGANHKASDEHVWAKLDDSEHPLNRPFKGASFDYRDEFFRVHEPYSRQRLRVLFSIDTNKTDLTTGPKLGNVSRPDDDYALAWIRSYGRGRIFYCTIAHNPYVFWDPKMLEFYLGAIQFALGDLPTATTPSAKLTPATRAQEKLGWRLGAQSRSGPEFTFFEAIENTSALGLCYIGGLSSQKVSKNIPRNFDPNLTDDELRQVRLKLDDAGLRLLTYDIQDIPGDEANCRKIFEFGRKMGIETFIAEPKQEALDTIEKFCEEYGINVALHTRDQKISPLYSRPEAILEVCKGRSKHLGACADIGRWVRAGIDPLAGLTTLGDRLITLQMDDLDRASPDARDVPWGTGCVASRDLLAELSRHKLKPTMIGLEYPGDWQESRPKLEQSIKFFDSVALILTP